MALRGSAVGLTLAGWAGGLATSALILGTPYLVFAYHNPSLHLVLDSFDGFVALLVAFLVYGRLQRSGRLQDLLLLQSLLLLGVAGLATAVLVDVQGDGGPGTLDVWAPLSLRVAAALLIAVAALMGVGSSEPARWRPVHVIAPLGLVVAGLLALWVFENRLPHALVGAGPPSVESPAILGHPLLLSVQGIAAACFVIASIAFTVQAVRREDELMRWLGPACALGAFARLNYLLFPSLYSDWLYTGDLLRTGCYLLLLVGAGREIREYWQAQTATAVLEDRRRLARELHDGVIQELTYIRGEALAMPAEADRSARVVDASERALDEARAAVHALGLAGREPMGSLLHRAASQVTDRYHADLDLDIDNSVAVPPEHQHALMRITREAVSNAVRHGRSSRINVRLHQDASGRHLVIEDDGRGFDVPSTVDSGSGFGLTSMRERAEALPGGSLSIEASQGAGSVVRLTW